MQMFVVCGGCGHLFGEWKYMDRKARKIIHQSLRHPIKQHGNILKIINTN